MFLTRVKVRGVIFIQHVQIQLKLTEWVQAKGMRARQRIERKAAYLHELQAQVSSKISRKWQEIEFKMKFVAK